MKEYSMVGNIEKPHYININIVSKSQRCVEKSLQPSDVRCSCPFCSLLTQTFYSH